MQFGCSYPLLVVPGKPLAGMETSRLQTSRGQSGRRAVPERKRPRGFSFFAIGTVSSLHVVRQDQQTASPLLERSRTRFVWCPCFANVQLWCFAGGHFTRTSREGNQGRRAGSSFTPVPPLSFPFGSLFWHSMNTDSIEYQMPRALEVPSNPVASEPADQMMLTSAEEKVCFWCSL